jgi:di/tricarboxylate transporter
VNHSKELRGIPGESKARAVGINHETCLDHKPSTKAASLTNPQILIFAILVAMMGLFLWGRFRHDVVALAALMVCVITGLVPTDATFSGFSHPAVITVACVLVLSQGLRNTSLVSAPGLGVLVLRGINNLELGVGLVSGLGIVLLAVMLDRTTKAALNRVNATRKG